MDIQITPKIWGPLCWNLLHGISMTYKKKYKDKYFYLLKKLEYILPCPKCITHLKLYIHDNGIEQKEMNKKYLVKWLIDLHNNINVKLKKKKLTRKKALELIKNKNYVNNKNIITFFIIINYFYLTKKLSLFHFQKIKSFYKLMAYIYPDKDIKKKIYKIIHSQEFKDISSEDDLNKLFKTKFNELI